MSEFVKLDKNNMPEPNTLLWCKRHKGPIYLATRRCMPLSTDGDIWHNCHWYGYPEAGGMFCTDGMDMEHYTNFSDQTVDSWCYVSKPELEK